MPEELDKKEIEYIKYYDNYNNGYNLTEGGSGGSKQSKLTQEEIMEIVNLLKNSNMTMEDISKQYGVTVSLISMINNGKCHSDYIKENYPIRNSNKFHVSGDICYNAKSTNDEILEIRKRYINETLAEIYQDYKDKYSYYGFVKIIQGISFVNLPVYKKRQKRWFLNGTCIDYPG